MKSICKNCEIEFDYHPSQKNGLYCSNKCQGIHTVRKRFRKGTKFRQTMRKFLIENREYSCSVCGIYEWNETPITLQIDHIDGDKENNTLENLRFLCPNCHSQTNTWGIGNISEQGKLRLITNIKKK